MRVHNRGQYDSPIITSQVTKYFPQHIIIIITPPKYVSSLRKPEQKVVTFQRGGGGVAPRHDKCINILFYNYSIIIFCKR